MLFWREKFSFLHFNLHMIFRTPFIKVCANSKSVIKMCSKVSAHKKWNFCTHASKSTRRTFSIEECAIVCTFRLGACDRPIFIVFFVSLLLGSNFSCIQKCAEFFRVLKILVHNRLKFRHDSLVTSRIYCAFLCAPTMVPSFRPPAGSISITYYRKLSLILVSAEMGT
jgi:hypothetical protein